MPIYVDLLFGFGIAYLIFRAGTAEAIVAALSICLTCGAAIVLSFVLSSQFTLYYREHEKFARPGSVYEPKVNETLSEPHGDLFAVDPALARVEKNPRQVRFQTDSLGFRNDSDYHGQRFALVGDSFVVANGVSQEFTLSNGLRDHRGIDTYNLRFPSGPVEYERRANWFLSLHPVVRFIFFFYEGNDFVPRELPSASAEPSVVLPETLADLLTSYDAAKSSLFRPLRYFTFYQGLALRLERKFVQRVPSEVHVERLGSHEVGFLKAHTRVARSRDLSFDIDGNPRVWNQTSCVFFIPTKDRVYRDEISYGSTITEPPTGFEVLTKYFDRFGIRVIDLTPILRARAKELRNEGRLVFWADDTHWNAEGIAAAAGAVARCLRDNSAHVPRAPVYQLDPEGVSLADTRWRFATGGRSNIEAPSTVAGNRHISGWALGAKSVPEQIVAFAGSQFVAVTPLRFSRTDVQQAFGIPNDKCGFEIVVPGNYPSIRLFALSETEGAFEIETENRG